MGAHQTMMLLENEQTAGAKTAVLDDLMKLRMSDTGGADKPACMLTYYEKLQELDSPAVRSFGLMSYARKTTGASCYLVEPRALRCQVGTNL